MKRMQLLSAALILALTAGLVSCKPSRVWATKDKDRSSKEKEEYYEKRNDRNDYEERYTPPPPPPRYSGTTRLIISPSPGFVMNRYPDGRYYHRSPSGLLYWKAPDNRFFLDKSFIGRVRYDQYEYQQWKQYNRSQNYHRGY